MTYKHSNQLVICHLTGLDYVGTCLFLPTICNPNLLQVIIPADSPRSRRFM